MYMKLTQVFEICRRITSALLFSTKAGQKLLKQLMIESHATSGKEDRKSFEMIYTLVSHLIEQDFAEQLYEALRDQDVNGDEEYKIQYHGEGFHDDVKEEEAATKIQGLRIEEIEDEETLSKTETSTKQEKKGLSYLTQEQVTLLKMIDSRIYTHHQNQQESFQQQQQEHATSTVPSVYDPFAVDETDPPVSLHTVNFLTETFSKVSALTIEVFQGLDKGGVGEHGVEDLANLSSGLMLLLGCFAHLSLHEDGQVSLHPKAGPGHDNVDDADDDVEEEIEQRADIVLVPDWFKAQHMAMVSGGLVESSIGKNDCMFSSCRVLL